MIKLRQLNQCEISVHYYESSKSSEEVQPFFSDTQKNYKDGLIVLYVL